VTAQHLLEQFPAIRTRDAEELTAQVVGLTGARSFDVRLGEGRLDARVNQHKLRDTAFFYATFGAPIQIVFPEVDFFRIQMALRGSASTVGQRGQVVAAPGERCVICSNQRLIQHYSADLAHLVVRIDARAVVAKLGALIGAQPKEPLRFQESADLVGDRAQTLRRLALFLVRELDLAQPRLHTLAVTELEQTLMVAFLCGARHNFSDLLDREPLEVAPWQVRRAEEFIAANWNQPITVEGLAQAVGASVRTIFRCFKQSRGFGPMVFVKQMRLAHARELLNRGDAGTTVTGTALSCGFRNVGHFAMDYRRAFGELPSETFNRAMSSSFVAERRGSRAPRATPTSTDLEMLPKLNKR